MLTPARMSPRTRRVAAALVHRVWGWASAVGTVTPDDRHGFRSMGVRSSISFPPGDVSGAWWIAIGAETLVGPSVTLSVGLPGEDLDPAAPPVVTIGARCLVARGCSIVARRSVVIEDDVTIGPNVYVTDHNHAYADVAMPIGRQYPTHDPVRIGAGTWIGAGTTVLPGASIGCNVAIAAGSVVRGEVPDRCVIAGSPARVVRRYVDGEWDPPLRAGSDDSMPPDWPTA